MKPHLSTKRLLKALILQRTPYDRLAERRSGNAPRPLPFTNLSACYPCDFLSPRFLSPNKWTACDGALNVHFYRSDDLNPRTEEDKFQSCVYDGVNFCITFANDEILGEFDTLVVNAGAHLPGKGLDAYAATMEAASTSLEASMRRLHGDDAILVVRNTPPGHGNCAER